MVKAKRDGPAVFPSSPELSLGKGGGAEWMIKRVDGHVLRFQEMTTLQKWIVASKVGRDDEISRTGKTWKALGDVAELASFFQGMDGASTAPSVPTAAGLGQVNVRAAVGDAVLGHGAALHGDDPVRQMITRRRNGAMAIALVAAGVGMVALITVGPTAPTARAHPAIEACARALRDDQLEGLRAARSSFDGASDPVARAMRVRVDIAIAAHLHAQAQALEVLASTSDPASSAAAEAQGEAAQKALAQAYAALTQLRADTAAATPQLVELHLASAAYQLANGAFAEQRADLENARAAARSASDLDDEAKAKVDAEVAIAQALADAAAGLTSDAAAALARAPASNDGRLRYARAALAVAAVGTPPVESDVLRARAVVSALPTSDQRRALLLSIVDAATTTPVPEAAPAPDEGTPLLPASAAASPGSAEGEASYVLLMQRAERAGDKGRSVTAYDLFMRASKLEPEAGRPWLGIGWAALDLGRNTEAVRAFDKAFALDDGLSEAKFGLAEALVSQGRNDEAKRAYLEYLRREPTGRDAAIAQRALEALE
jgi:hypothetical protein